MESWSEAINSLNSVVVGLSEERSIFPRKHRPKNTTSRSPSIISISTYYLQVELVPSPQLLVCIPSTKKKRKKKKISTVASLGFEWNEILVEGGEDVTMLLARIHSLRHLGHTVTSTVSFCFIALPLLLFLRYSSSFQTQSFLVLCSTIESIC